MTKIHEYDPQIYPFKLWVAVKPDFATLNKKFDFMDVQRDIVDISEGNIITSHPSRTFIVTLKSGNDGGLLVCVNKPNVLNISSIAHESCHCADYICEIFSFPQRTFDNGEPYAYLVGWFAKCIEKTLKGKRK